MTTDCSLSASDFASDFASDCIPHQVIRKWGILQGGCIWDWVDQGLLMPGAPRKFGCADCMLSAC